MAGHNYMYRGYTDDQNNANYGAFECSDHVCRPIIVDSEGRKMPIIFYTPNHHDSKSYVASTETIVEHTCTPVVVTTEYEYSTPTKVEPVKDYGVTNDVWRRPSSPVLEYGYNSPTKIEPIKDYGVTDNKWQRPSSRVHEYGYSSPTKIESVKGYGVTNGKWRRPSIPVHEYGYNSPKKVEPVKDYGVTNDKWRRPSSSSQDRPQKVEEFITSIQTEVGRPTRSGLLRAPNWRNNTPNSKTGQVGNIGYGDYTNYNNNDDWNTPNVNTIRDGSLADPFIANRDVRERPNHNGTPLSGPTNTYTETIDSREAQRRYGKLNQSSRSFQTGESHTGTIDSKEAARKYKGTNVW
ncbi:hypothetical protein TEA_016627 [Camellia sinensis var. sinensis]|uniref:Uncharacterized protein n=1 Tax=Camellia sinensis var. sinensis TaxID=542762 RepID=A0A4S4DVV2_CAMSN|nr:hypothetical protein TEA_016627 [Camellia sinensis var. sinensis]